MHSDGCAIDEVVDLRRNLALYAGNRLSEACWRMRILTAVNIETAGQMWAFTGVNRKSQLHRCRDKTMANAGNISFHVTARRIGRKVQRAKRHLPWIERRADLAAEPHCQLPASHHHHHRLELATANELDLTRQSAVHSTSIPLSTHLHKKQPWTPTDSSASPSRNG
jgi:hypothetical protein